jgi:hypothetical protein
MSKPLLSKSRFTNLLSLVQPPKCQWHNAVIANEQFELSDEQREQLQRAIWLMFRYYTGTMTDEDKAMIGRGKKEAFAEVNSVTNYKWY